MSDYTNNKTGKKFSRRNFIKTTALSGIGIGPAILNACYTANSDNGRFQNQGEAKNIIFMVSDGMSSGTLSMADILKHRKKGQRSNWITLYNSKRDYHRGLMDMASLDSLVTDSAAAGSSWGSGHRVKNGALNVGPDGNAYTPINQIFKDAGKKTGLVTTTRITHATPASFSICHGDRNEEEHIADSYLKREYDLFMGGGARHFMAEQREDRRNLIQDFEDKQYHVIRNRSQLKNVTHQKRLLGLFHNDHLPYSIDRQSNNIQRKSIPTLAEMTEKALELLDNQAGFILQVEGGRVDHGAHNNDASAMLYDQLAFDEAIGVALDFVDNRDDTLLVITTDHGNANPALNGDGPHYRRTNKRFDHLQDVRYSNTWALSGLNTNNSISEIRERIEQATNIGIRKEEAEAIKQSINGNMNSPFYMGSSPDIILGDILANYTAVSFTSGNHTSDYIELTALGPGSSNFDYFTRNTQIFEYLLNATGLAHKADISF